MGRVSASREYFLNGFNPGVMIRIAQQEIVGQGSSDKFSIQIRFEDEYGLTADKELTVEEACDIREIGWLRELNIDTELFHIHMFPFGKKAVVSVFSDSRDQVLAILNRIDGGGIPGETSERENTAEKVRITDDVIQRLVLDGKKQVEGDKIETGGIVLVDSCSCEQRDKDSQQNIPGQDVMELVQYFLEASVYLVRPDALKPVEGSTLSKVFMSDLRAVGLGYAELNPFHAAGQALKYPLFKNNIQEDLDWFGFIACPCFFSVEEIESVILFLEYGISNNNPLMFGAYIDKKLENEFMVGLLGFERRMDADETVKPGFNTP